MMNIIYNLVFYEHWYSMSIQMNAVYTLNGKKALLERK